MAHNTRGPPPASYIDGISVKISERYKPPKRITAALSHSQTLSLAKLMNNPLPSYDFKLEESIKNRMSEWRRARKQITESRKLRLRQLDEENATKCDEIVENCEVLSDEEPCYNLSSNYSMESGVLIPMTVNSKLPANVSEHLSYQMNKVFNFSEFESDTSSPFDNMELKTINDLEELAEVLKRDSVNTKLIKNAHLTNNNNDPATSPATISDESIKKNFDPTIDTISFHNSSPNFSVSNSFSNNYPQNIQNHSKDSNTTSVYSYHSASPTLSATDSSFSNSYVRNNPKDSFDSSKDNTINSIHSTYNNQNMKTFDPSSPTYSNAYSQNTTNTYSALEAFPNNSYNQNIKNEPSNNSTPPQFSNLKHPNSTDVTSYNNQNIKTHEPSTVLDSFASYNPQTSNQSVLDPYSSYTYKTNFMDSKDSHMNGCYYPNSPHFASRLYDPADLKSEQMRDPSMRSVHEIMKSLEAELAHTHLSTPEQSPVAASPVAAASTSSSPPVKQPDTFENPFTTLGNDLQEMALKISGMGFPLARVARACLAMDGNQKKIVEHLLVMAELLDLGFTEQNVVAALLKTDNDRDKALDLLIT